MSESRHRFFVESLAAGRVALDAGESHHAMHVLRLRAGEAVELLDGRGGVGEGRVWSAGRRQVVVDVRQVRCEERPRPAVHVAFATPKGPRLDWLLEKCTELGAASLRAVVFERGVAGGTEMSTARRQRWRGRCVAAAKQSGWAYLPEIVEPVSLAELLAWQGTAAGLLRLLGDVEQDAGLVGEALAGRGGRDVLIVVGPEGGLSPVERRSALEAACVPVRVGPAVLRIETAAVALLAAVQAGVWLERPATVTGGQNNDETDREKKQGFP